MGDGTSEDAIPGLPDCGESIDQATFSQILEMDDDEDEREFSKSIVYGFFDQAENTFQKMDANLQDQNLDELSQLGHFLKGSSATLGLTLVKHCCEKIQHLGHHKDETGSADKPRDYCLHGIQRELGKLRTEYQHVKRILRKFYGEESG